MFIDQQPCTPVAHSWETAVSLLPELGMMIVGSLLGHYQSLEQLLGLPPSPIERHFAEIWVDPKDLFRPAPNPDIATSQVSLEFPKDISQEHIEWFKRVQELNKERFALTGRGYTYDWGNPESDFGLSEFVIRRGTTIEVRSLMNTSDYCLKKI